MQVNISRNMKYSNSTAIQGCNGQNTSTTPRAEEVLYAIYLLILLFLSAIGNVLVCLAIARFRHLRTPTNSFIFSLAVTDFLTPFGRLLYIAVAFLQSEWVFGCFWCKLSSVLGVLLCASSIMHLCAISVERFIVIKWPLEHQNWITTHRVAFVIGNIWVSALLLSLFPYFGFVDLTFSFELLDCEISWQKNPKMALVLALFFFLFPFLIMSVTYYYIFKEVHRQSRRISGVGIQGPPVGPVRRKSFGVKIRISRIIRQELKAVKIIVVVIGAFFLLWLPFFTVTAIRAYMPSKVSGAVQRLVFALAYSNSSCNWIIYSVMNKQLREAFKIMITTCSSRLQSSLQEDSTSAGQVRRAYNAVRAANVIIAGTANSRALAIHQTIKDDASRETATNIVPADVVTKNIAESENLKIPCNSTEVEQPEKKLATETCPQVEPFE